MQRSGADYTLRRFYPYHAFKLEADDGILIDRIYHYYDAEYHTLCGPGMDVPAQDAGGRFCPSLPVQTCDICHGIPWMDFI